MWPRPRYRFRRVRLGLPWCEGIELADGRRLILRPIAPSDADTLRKSFGRLTREEIRFRFLRPITELTPAYARSLTHLDGRREFALVLAEALPPGDALIGGVGRVAAHDDEGEFALIVGREIGGFGLGTYLLQRLTEWCRKRGLARIAGDVMLENQRMLELVRRLGFRFSIDLGAPDVLRVWKPLRPTAAQTSSSGRSGSAAGPAL